MFFSTTRLVHLTISLFMVGYVSSVQSRFCCTPPQWEAAFDLITGGLNHGTEYFVQESQNVSVDQNAHKVASSLQVITNGVTTQTKLIQDYDGGKQYTITNGVCQMSPLTPWTPKCVPDNAQLLQKTYFGTGDKKIDFDVYMFRDDAKANLYYLDVASADCTPLYIVGYGGQNNVTGFTIGTYSNTTLGIKDPSVFDIPEACKKQPFRTHTVARHLHSLF